MEKVAKLISAGEVLSEVGEKYFRQIEDTILRADPALYKQLQESRAGYKSYLGELKSGPALTSESVSGSFTALTFICDRLDKIRSALAIQYAVVTNDSFARPSLAGMSTTFTHGFQRDRTVIIRSVEEYQSLISEFYELVEGQAAMEIAADPTLAPRIVTQLLGGESLGSFERLIIRVALPFLSAGGKEAVISRIEKEKDKVLGARRTDRDYLPSEFVPVMQYVSIGVNVGAEGYIHALDEISKGILDNSDALTRAVRKLLGGEDHPDTIGLVVIAGGGANEIDYFPWTMFSPAYIQAGKLETTLEAGLNNRVLQRWNTTVRIPAVQSPLRIFVSREDLPFYNLVQIICREDGEILARIYGWGDVTTAGVTTIGVDHKLCVDLQRVIPRRKLAGLIEGVTSRPSNYVKQHEATIVQRFFDDAAHSILHSIQEPTRTGVLIDKLKTACEDVFGRWNVGELSGVKALILRITSAEIGDAITDAIAEQILPEVISPTERAITGLILVHGVATNLTRSITRELQSVVKSFPADLFRARTKASRAEFILSAFKSAVDSAFLREYQRMVDFQKSIKLTFVLKKHAVL